MTTFIKELDNTIKTAIQVCWELNKQNREREFNGLLEAMKKFKLNKGLILTNDQEEIVKINGKTITVKPAWLWLYQL